MPTLLGITGNVASGKSAVRQYLENEGALTIDADLLAQSNYSVSYTHLTLPTIYSV